MRHGRGVADTLTAQTRAWPTPIQGDAHLSSTPEAAQRRLDEGKTTLSRSVQAWPTPAASTGEGGAHGLDGGAGARAMLAAAGGLGNWPTPDAMVANDGQDSASYESRRRRLQEKHRNSNGAGLVLAHAGTSLTDAVNGGQKARIPWATPTRQDGANNGGPSQVEGRNSQPLNAQAGGALNPEWVECLMGWPRGWTALDPVPSVEFSPWPAPPGPQYPWEPSRLVPRGTPGRTARLRMLGNGQVPATAVMAWRMLSGGTP